MTGVQTCALPILSVKHGFIEPGLLNSEPEKAYQFEREGYFVADRYDHSAEAIIFNKTIGLRDVGSEK